MFGKRLPLFRLFGFQVKLDVSWFILAVLITWSLATGLFPHYYEDFSQHTYWWMGVAGAIGLFLSIIIHEFSHSLVARMNGIPMRGITLFIFGGVAEMDEEPPTAKGEFLMSVAGPLTSIILGIVFWMISRGVDTAGLPDAVGGVVVYLYWINFLLAGFNLLPAFPLDGGRLLRAVLWIWKGNLRWATHITSRIGAGFGIALIIFGILHIVGGNFVGGLWLLLIGMFLKNAAQMSYKRLITRQVLEGEPVRKFMEDNVQTVDAGVSVNDLVEHHIYKHHYKMFPVMRNGKLEGCVTTREVKEVSREEWEKVTVGEIARPCSDENTISADEDATQALATMNRTGASRLLVIDNGRLAGIITLKDMLKFLSLKLELEVDE